VTTALSAGRPVAIAGYGQTPVVRHADAALGVLAARAVRAAAADAALELSDVDGFVTVAGMPSLGSHQSEDGVSFVSAEWLVAHLGTHPRYVQNIQGATQFAGAVANAVNAIACGAAENVVVYRALHNPRSAYHYNSARQFGGPQQWTAPQGYFGPIAAIALAYQAYLARYNASPDTLARVAVEARRNGARIPWSYWHDKPLAREEYLAAPFICDPMRRLDCDIPVDGVGAFLLTSADRARDLPNRPVRVAGYALSGARRHRMILHWPLEDIQASGADLARRTWEATGLKRADVDLPQVYDGFAPFVYLWLEALGYCPPGEGHRFVADGGIEASSSAGVPLLSGGGSLGTGRMHGFSQFLECYLQVAGRAGERQRDRVSVGLACYGPPHIGGVVGLTQDI
jgi:acetyl-CoA acetyltransferase